MIECSNGSYYTGYTTNIHRRYAEHVEGSLKCKYTLANPPKKLAANWLLNVTLSDILRIEYAIKKLSRKHKLELVHNQELIQNLLVKLNIVVKVNEPV